MTVVCTKINMGWKGLRVGDITVGDDFVHLFIIKISYKHVSKYEWLWSYDCLKLCVEGKE